MEGRTPNNSVAEQHSVFVGPFETQIAPPKYAGAFTDQELGRIGYIRARRHLVSRPMHEFTSWLRSIAKDE